MSEVKIHALEYASRFAHATFADFLSAAASVEAFIGGSVASATKTAGKGKSAAGAAAAATTETLPSSATSAPVDKAPATKAATGGATKEAVGAVMVKLIQANLREKVVEILKSVGSADLSGIPADKYDAVIASANEALLLA
jgi:hypothetical protein